VPRTAPASPSVIDIDEEILRAWPLPLPEVEGDKDRRGRVLLIAGSRQIPGAAVLAASAALRAGAGRVTIAAPESIAQSMAFAVPEARVFALGETAAGGVAIEGLEQLDELAERTQSVLIGPGLPYDGATRELATAVMEKFSQASIILDAGAMNVVKHSRTRFPAPVLLTPHAGEMAGLTAAEKNDVLANPADAARDAARSWNAVVALKGAITWIAAPDARVWRHEGGNVGLAISGSGDVLAGVIAGLAARGASLEQASAWGVALHARAGERLAKRLGLLGYFARELPGEIPALMAALS
jgi:hydroxyethylthiazole kinase-like uncharacterized protein yjeF